MAAMLDTLARGGAISRDEVKSVVALVLQTSKLINKM